MREKSLDRKTRAVFPLRRAVFFCSTAYFILTNIISGDRRQRASWKQKANIYKCGLEKVFPPVMR